MAISISRAGKLIVDESGYVTAPLASIEVCEHPESSNGDRQQLQFIFRVPTNKGISADKYLWTGLTINAEKSHFPIDLLTGERSAVGEYNLLTQMLLALGMITEAILQSDDEIDLDIESLVGRTFEFQVTPNRSKPGLSDIVVKSIRFAASAAK